MGNISGKTQQCGTPPCIDTGILATKWLMELLSIRGRTDVGLDLAFQTDYPSWGYMARMNSTTVVIVLLPLSLSLPPFFLFVRVCHRRLLCRCWS